LVASMSDRTFPASAVRSLLSFRISEGNTPLWDIQAEMTMALVRT
jgi:hypothetical protein